MGFKIIYGDITDMETDAIVNAANSRLRVGGGVCGAIFKKAGAKELQKECDNNGYCPTGQAIITSGYKLKAKYIIHAVGPIYQDGKHDEAKLLAEAYHNALLLAKQYNCHSIAFPLISSGIYGFPYNEALEIAKAMINNFLVTNNLDVFLVLLKFKIVMLIIA